MSSAVSRVVVESTHVRSCEFCSVTGGGGGKHTWEVT